MDTVFVYVTLVLAFVFIVGVIMIRPVESYQSKLTDEEFNQLSNDEKWQHITATFDEASDTFKSMTPKCFR